MIRKYSEFIKENNLNTDKFSPESKSDFEDLKYILSELKDDDFRIEYRSYTKNDESQLRHFKVFQDIFGDAVSSDVMISIIECNFKDNFKCDEIYDVVSQAVEFMKYKGYNSNLRARNYDDKILDLKKMKSFDQHISRFIITFYY